MKTLSLKKSIFQAGKLVVLSGIFVGLGTFIVLSAEKSPLIGWLNIAFFGFGLSLGLFQLFDRRPQLIADGQTLFDRTNLTEPISWSAVEKLTLLKTGFILSKQTIIIVELKPFRASLSSKIRKRLFKKPSENGKPYAFSIPLTPLEGKAEETFAVLTRLKDEADANFPRDF